jgi:hypothetical protein
MVKSADSTTRLLAILITILALADGVLHFSLDYVLFRGNLFGRLGPPPGAPAPPPGGGGPEFPLPLNQLFVLNLCGYIVLLLIFWFIAPRLGNWAWLVDAVFIVYVAIIFVGWVSIGGPNPRGLGYLSKTIEILLILALLAHMWTLLSRTRSSSPATVA